MIYVEYSNLAELVAIVHANSLILMVIQFATLTKGKADDDDRRTTLSF